VTLIQRFGSALNLNIHFHMLFLDGTYADGANGSSWFRWVNRPTSAELTQLAHTTAQRVGRCLERQGWLTRDVENSYLASDVVDRSPDESTGGEFHYLPHRCGTAAGSQGFHPANPAGLRSGRSVWRLARQCRWFFPCTPVSPPRLMNGRSRNRRRYISRPAISEKRLSLTRGGNVRY